MEQKTKISIYAICSVAALWLIVLFFIILGYFAVDLYKSHHKPVQSKIPEIVNVSPSIPTPIVVAPVVANTEDSFSKCLEETNKVIEKTFKELEVDINTQIENLKSANEKNFVLISLLTKRADELSQRVKDNETSIREVKNDLFDKNMKINERIDGLVKEIVIITDRIASLQTQIDENTKDIKFLYTKLEEHRKLLVEYKSLIDKNAAQIEDMKLLFYNYDAVLAAEKAKKK